MARYKKIVLIILCLTGPGIVTVLMAQPLSLQQLLDAMGSNYQLLKREASLIQSQQAAAKAVNFNRLPRLNTIAQATVGSANSLDGAYLPYGVIPSVAGSIRPNNIMSAASGDNAFAGLNWEAFNFGEYAAQEKLAKSALAVQTNTYASTQYDLDGFAAAYYIELQHQYELQKVQQDNVLRLQQLKTSIDALVGSGVKPGVDSSVAAAELSKSIIALYQAQKNLAQTKVQLSTLTSLPVSQLNPDTTAENKLNVDGVAFVYSATIDTLHHPYINLYTSIYDESQARLKLEKNSYYPKIWLDADAWVRGSSLSPSDVYSSDLWPGYEPSRFNYLFGLTMTYDIFNIAHKRLNSNIYKFQSEAALHNLQNEKITLNGDVQQALLEKDFQLNRLFETKHELDQAATAFNEQYNLYRNGLSSVIELTTAEDYYIQAQRDYVEAKVGLMKSVINYSLVTNSFNTLVQTLKL